MKRTQTDMKIAILHSLAEIINADSIGEHFTN